MMVPDRARLVNAARLNWPDSQTWCYRRYPIGLARHRPITMDQTRWILNPSGRMSVL